MLRNLSCIEAVIRMHSADPHRSEHRYQAVLEAIDQGFCVIEVVSGTADRACDYRFLEVNPAFERLTGIADAVGRSMREIAPEHEQRWFDRYADVARTGRPVRFEQEAQALAGGRWFDVFAFRVDDPREQHVAILFSDVTDRKRTDLALTRSEAALRSADRRKDDFLATLAHELRNPLAPIRNGVEVLRRIAGTNPTLQHTTQMMERQMRHLVRLVDDLLDVSRITRGKVELRRERVPIQEVVGLALECSQALFGPKNQTLSVVLAPEPMLVLGDPDRLRQVFSNLLANASKFTPRGGSVRLTLERGGAHAFIRVRDTGIGIPAERLEHVFEMFTQVSGPGANDGLGIGLALAKQLVELHRGSIEARSEGLGKGSEFVVCLPLIAEEPETSVPSEAAHASMVDAGLGRQRVLVVDDNVDGAESLAAVLRLRGHDVRTAGGGEEAVALAASDSPDIVLLDIGMPGMDGLTVARLIRQQPGGTAIRIIALTGWGEESDRERTRAAGIEEHLVKPVSPAALLELLERS